LVAFDCPAGNEQRDAGNPIEHTPDTAPYFHNNSAKTLDEVLDHYSIFFSQFADGTVGLGCDPEAAQCLSEADKVDIINFMQLLSFENSTGHGLPMATTEAGHDDQM
jgi:hypothetical protein